MCCCSAAHSNFGFCPLFWASQVLVVSWTNSQKEIFWITQIKLLSWYPNIIDLHNPINQPIDEGFRYLYCDHEASLVSHPITQHKHLTCGHMTNHMLTLLKLPTRQSWHSRVPGIQMTTNQSVFCLLMWKQWANHLGWLWWVRQMVGVPVTSDLLLHHH